jgi:hypothetical protein
MKNAPASGQAWLRWLQESLRDADFRGLIRAKPRRAVPGRDPEIAKLLPL